MSAIDNILASVDKMYPGLLEERHVLDVLTFNGVLNPICVQVRASAVSSSALIEAMSKGGFREHMISTPGMQINTIAGRSYVASLPPGGVSIVGGYKSELVDLEHFESEWSDGRHGLTAEQHSRLQDMMNTQSGTSYLKTKTGLCIRPLTNDVTLNLTGTSVFNLDNIKSGHAQSAAYVGYLDNIINTVLAYHGVEPKLAIAVKFNGDAGLNGTMTSGEFATYPDSDGAQWEALLKKYSRMRVISDDIMTTGPGLGNLRSMPTIPGYSRVFISGQVNNTSSTWGICTYVKGDAWMDYHYGQYPFFSKGGHWKAVYKAHLPSHSFPAGRDQNEFPVPKAPTTHPISIFGLSFADLQKYAKSSGNTYTSGYEGCTLFGAPYVDMAVTGQVVTESNVVKFNNLDVTVNAHEISVDQFRWVLNKNWYREYYTTGYGVFTPRASNIQANVLKTWDELSYDEIIVRGLTEPYKFKMTVSTLPEAKIYAKGRAKACKTNDWMEQAADNDKSVTWGRVDSLCKAMPSRQVFISTQNTLGTSSVAINKNSDPVTYAKENGIIKRTQSGVTVAIDPQVEDDRGVVLYDKYFGTVTLSDSLTWDEIIVEDDLEKESLTDTSDFTVNNGTMRLGEPTNGKLVGFGKWIDPFPKGDITDLNDEQLFRLHIKNLIELDRMTAPLLKIINSFGYNTIIKFAK